MSSPSLAAQTERNRRAGAKLLEEIRDVIKAHQGQAPLTARQVRSRLHRKRLTIRRVQQVLAFLRKNPADVSHLLSDDHIP